MSSEEPRRPGTSSAALRGANSRGPFDGADQRGAAPAWKPSSETVIRERRRARDLALAAVDGAEERVDAAREGDDDGDDRRRSRAPSSGSAAGRAARCGSASARGRTRAGAGACRARRARSSLAERNPTRIASIGGTRTPRQTGIAVATIGSTRPSSAPRTKTRGSNGRAHHRQRQQVLEDAAEHARRQAGRAPIRRRSRRRRSRRRAAAGGSRARRAGTPSAIPMPISRRWASTIRLARLKAANAAPARIRKAKIVEQLLVALGVLVEDPVGGLVGAGS